jgi:hypothetical protein
VALPEGARDGVPGFEHYAPPEVAGEGSAVRVFLGSLLGSTSPVATATPLLGAELLLDPGVALEIDVETAYEHGVLLDTGSLHVAGTAVAKDELGYVPPGSSRLSLRAGADGARLLLLGGPPFGEPIVMWWNFVGRTHDEIVASRDAWQAQIRDGQQVRSGRFGVVLGEHLAPIPAPPLPNARLKERS